MLLPWLPALVLAERGFPLYFASFENVGVSEVYSDIKSAGYADDQITKHTRGCPSDVYVIVNDHNPFDLSGLKRIHNAAQNSLTRISLLTSDLVNMQELAVDLEDYCEAELVDVEVGSGEEVERYVDTKTRVFYVNIPLGVPNDAKDAALTQIFGVLPSPYVTVCYTSHVEQAQPVLRSVVESKQRRQWKDIRNRKEQIRPIIAPLFEKKNVGHTAPEPTLELPDNFFMTLAIGSIMFALFLAYRDIQSSGRKSKKLTSKQAVADGSSKDKIENKERKKDM